MQLTQTITVVPKTYLTETIWKTEMKHESQKELQTMLFSLLEK
jgi:hypothetical protein